jgi:hypothetical protein
MQAPRVLSLAVALIYVVLLGQSTDLPLTGKVLDASGSPVAGARIVAMPSKSTVYSDATGTFPLRGEWRFSVIKEGFSVVEVQLDPEGSREIVLAVA